MAKKEKEKQWQLITMEMKGKTFWGNPSSRRWRMEGSSAWRQGTRSQPTPTTRTLRATTAALASSTPPWRVTNPLSTCFTKTLNPAPPDVLQRYGDDFVTRLKMLYTQAKELAESEVNVSTQLMGQLDAFMLSGAPCQQRRRKEPNEPKRRQLKADSDISMHSTSVENHLDTLSSLTGEQVAARVTEGAEKDQWVVAKVTHFARESGEVEVVDEEPGDDEEGGSQRKYKLLVSDIIPFPKRNDISGARNFRRGEKVLAVYPDTTTLYKATVVRPRKQKTNDYVLEFDDDEDGDGFLPQIVVPFYWVVGLPEGRIVAVAHKGRK